MINCQLKNCYDETDKMIKHSFEEIKKNVKDPKNKVVKKYEKKFSKKITPKALQQYDIDMMKVYK